MLLPQQPATLWAVFENKPWYIYLFIYAVPLLPCSVTAPKVSSQEKLVPECSDSILLAGPATRTQPMGVAELRSVLLTALLTWISVGNRGLISYVFLISRDGKMFCRMKVLLYMHIFGWTSMLTNLFAYRKNLSVFPCFVPKSNQINVQKMESRFVHYVQG